VKRLALVLLTLLLTGCAAKPTPSEHPTVNLPAVEPKPKETPPSETKPKETPPSETKPETPAKPTPEEQFKAAQAAAQAKDWATAKWTLLDVTSAKPDWAEAWDELARAELAQFGALIDSPSMAENAARQALTRKPDLPSAQYHLGLALIGRHAHGQALELLERLAKAHPEKAAYHVALGIAYMGLQRYEDARLACEQGRSEGPQLKAAEDCLNELGVGFPRLPASEFSFGAYEWQGAAKGYHWTGPQRSAEAELVRIHPPEYCALREPDGFSTHVYGCGQSDDRPYAWSFGAPFTGKSPKGIGIGSTTTDVAKAWGEGTQVGEQRCYAGEAVTLCLFFQKEAVAVITVSRIETDGPARALASEGY
jgi:hypothetical protein